MEVFGSSDHVVMAGEHQIHGGDTSGSERHYESG